MVKRAKSIAEYAIRKWMDENFFMSELHLTMMGNEAKLIDRNKDELILVYDGDSRTVYIKE